MRGGVVAASLRILGLGLVLSAMSEVWFYPVDLSMQILWWCAFYGLLGYAAWLVMAQLRVRTWRGAFWGACLFGFLIEGIPVPVLYSALPFSILWTSIAWHALVSVAVGLWGFRVLCARKGRLAQIAGCAVAGLYLGFWSVELWSLRNEDGPWVWTPTPEVSAQIWAGWAMFVGGHIAFDLAARFSTIPLRGEFMTFVILTVALFGLGMGIAMFPLSLVLPVLVALCSALMWKDGQGATGPAAPFLVRLSNMRVPLTGYAASALIPLVATVIYDQLRAADVQLESSAFHILWTGPLAITLVLWSAWRLARRA